MASETKVFGKIQAVHLGNGGYQDAMFGVGFSIGSSDWSTGDFWGFWAGEPRETTRWTMKDQRAQYGNTMQRLSALMRQAGVSDINDLVNTPIEAVFVDGALKSWRILAEVL